MLFSLDVRRARKGDCLLLHYGSKTDPHLILIDGGPSGVYTPHLKPRLVEIHKKRGLEEQAPLPVDIVMVSHVDDDHIKGILELTREQCGGTPDVRLRVGTLWHNSFDDILDTPVSRKAEAGTASVGEMGDGDAENEEFDAGSVLASVGAGVLTGDVKVEDESGFQAAQVLASIPQGRQLRDDAKVLGWKVNRQFNGKLIQAGDDSEPFPLGDGPTMAVAGPMQPELSALQKAHDKWLRERKKKNKKSPEATLAAFVDASVANLSSIVVLAEFKKKRILLTGDARGDKILEGMEMVGLLKKGGKMHVDVLKVPHHGSQHTMETVFFDRVTADHYVFSGNGEHGNPDRETLEMLFEARGPQGYTMHLTYPIAEIDEARKKGWKHQAGEGKHRSEKWSDKKHSLGSLLKQHGLEEDKDYKIVPKTGHHVIDLLDPLGF